MSWYPTSRGQVLGAIGAVCIAFVVGRGTQKTVTVEKIRTVEKEAEKKVEAAKQEVATAKKAADAEKIQWRTRTVYLPGGQVEVVKEVVREVDKGVVTTRVDVQTKTVTVEKLVYRDRVQTVTPALARWSIGAHVGVGLDLKERYGGEVGRRLVDGLWLRVGADVPTRAAYAGVRWEF